THGASVTVGRNLLASAFAEWSKVRLTALASRGPMFRCRLSAATVVSVCGTSRTVLSRFPPSSNRFRSRLMFLSKLVLNNRDRQAGFDLARPYEMHRTLLSGYPHARIDNRCDLLFRIEPLRTGPPLVLVQTRDAPEWSLLPVSYFLGPAECKPLDLPIKA